MLLILLNMFILNFSIVFQQLISLISWLLALQAHKLYLVFYIPYTNQTCAHCKVLMSGMSGTFWFWEACATKNNSNRKKKTLKKKKLASNRIELCFPILNFILLSAFFLHQTVRPPRSIPLLTLNLPFPEMCVVLKFLWDLRAWGVVCAYAYI